MIERLGIVRGSSRQGLHRDVNGEEEPLVFEEVQAGHVRKGDRQVQGTCGRNKLPLIEKPKEGRSIVMAGNEVGGR